VLCIHGFTATAFEMSHLGQRLAERGFTVAGMLLPGHGEDVAALDRTGWRDWFAGVEREWDRLRARCGRTAVVGQSLGGLLALHLARMRGATQVAAVASLGAPLWLPALAAYGIRAVDRLAAVTARVLPWQLAVPKRGGPDLRDRDMAARAPTLDGFPPRATRSLLELTRIVRAEVDQVNVPTFVAHARHDHVAPPACAAELARRVASRDVKLLWMERSFHILPLDVEKDQLADELGAFLAERM
jgi:carboxylesterase